MLLRFRKIVLQYRVINKTRSKIKNQEIKKSTHEINSKSQENFAHHFGDNYVTNHLVKFPQDRIKP